MRPGKINKRRLVWLPVLLVALVLGLGAAAGSKQDPLVTKSWVDQYIAAEVAAAEEDLNARLDEAEKRLDSTLVIRMWIGKTVLEQDGVEQPLEAAPYLTAGGRTMVPLRAVGEALGAQFVWDGAARQVTYKRDGTEIVLTLGSMEILVNGERREIDAAPQSAAGRTFVPLRVVTENLGFALKWDNAAKQATLLY